MKKVIVVTALALLFAGCGSGGDGQVVESDDSALTVSEEQLEGSSSAEESQVEESVLEEEEEENKPEVPPFEFDPSLLLELRDNAEIIQEGEGRPEGHLANSYYIDQYLEYPGMSEFEIEKGMNWEYTHQRYLPLFTDEIPYEGSDAIKEYYLAEFQQHAVGTEGMFEEMKQVSTDKNGVSVRWGHTSDYSVTFSENHVSVRFTHKDYYAGAGSIGYSIDNFNMHTGERLEKEDIFQDITKLTDQLPELLQWDDEIYNFITSHGSMQIHWDFQFAEHGIYILVATAQRGGQAIFLITYEELEEYFRAIP